MSLFFRRRRFDVSTLMYLHFRAVNLIELVLTCTIYEKKASLFFRTVWIFKVWFTEIKTTKRNPLAMHNVYLFICVQSPVLYFSSILSIVYMMRVSFFLSTLQLKLQRIERRINCNTEFYIIIFLFDSKIEILGNEQTIEKMDMKISENGRRKFIREEEKRNKTKNTNNIKNQQMANRPNFEKLLSRQVVLELAFI